MPELSSPDDPYHTIMPSVSEAKISNVMKSDEAAGLLYSGPRSAIIKKNGKR